MFLEYDLVALKNDLPEYGLKAGAIGTILMIYDDDPAVYEVEFCDEDGSTVALVTISGDTLQAR